MDACEQQSDGWNCDVGFEIHKNNPQNCVVEYRAMHIGSVNFDRVSIQCGDRTLYFDGDSEGKFSEDVTESIGEVPKEEH